MKFRYLFSILPIFMITFLFTGCGTTIEDLAKNNIAEMHNHYFIGSTENFQISLWSGVREEPFEPDGIRGQMLDFCILSVVPVGNVGTFGLNYNLEINDKPYSGEFQKSPFDNSFAAALDFLVTDSDTIFADIIHDGITETGKLSCVSCNFTVNSTQALDIAIENVGEQILALTDDNKSIEGYVRIITTDRNIGVYFWYIRFINTDGKEICLVIDTASGEIMASKL